MPKAVGANPAFVVSVRPRWSLIVPSIALVIAALPVSAQQLPPVDLPVDGVPTVPEVPGVDVAGPAAPEWIATYQGVSYYVLDGAVKRFDGLPVPAEAAHAVQLAQRASDLLAAHPAFVQRLQNADAESEIVSALAQAQSVAGHLQAAADLLDSRQTTGLLSGILPSLPFDATAFAEDADEIASHVATAQAKVEELAAARQQVEQAANVFGATHAVEDKVALYQAYAGAIPLYENAAGAVVEARAAAEAAAAHAAYAANGVDQHAQGLLGLKLPVELPAELASAADGLMEAAGPLHAMANHLQEDAAFMAFSLDEPDPASLPVAWVVSGGLAAVGAGAGGLYWLRRRLGLP